MTCFSLAHRRSAELSLDQLIIVGILISSILATISIAAELEEVVLIKWNLLIQIVSSTDSFIISVVNGAAHYFLHMLAWIIHHVGDRIVEEVVLIVGLLILRSER